jgi:type II secretory pathway pseudopilin PulG
MLFKNKLQRAPSKGFTIVELLIIIVVIGVLALIVINSFANAQSQARAAKVNHDLSVLHHAILAARESTGKTLLQITGSGCTRCSCPYLSGDTTPYNTLPKTSSCWINYYNMLSAVGTAANTSLSDLRDGDPWGTPYIVDENEGEQVGTPCRKDSILSAGPGSNVNMSGSLGNINVRYSLPQCV